MENESFLDTAAKSGFVYGLAATLLMTIVMALGMASGVSPIPEPIPVAFVKLIFGAAPKAVLMIAGMVLHFLYGGVAGLILFKIVGQSGRFWHGIVWGVILWLAMQVIVFPLLDWGPFAVDITFKVAVATLVLHLIYGSVVGYGLQHQESKEVSAAIE